jgi:hypothetical protein
MPDEPGVDSGAFEYLLPVHYDSSEHSLTILHPNLSLRPGDRVIWAFTGVPDGWAPWVQFKPGDLQPGFLGPFAGLTQIEGGIVGVCRAEIAKLPVTYTYRICLQKGLGLDWQAPTAAICSEQATLLVHGRERAATRIFHVRRGEEGKLTVEPLGQPLSSGETVEWIFDDPGDPLLWRPRINFGRYNGTGTIPNQLLGPFTCLVYEPGKVTGMGNSGVAGIYHFEVSLVSLATGEVTWISSGDPAIDNMGPVWDPVSGGPAG